ncbi:MAG: DNA replication/repair protein RecF [Acidimicrobiales bacterium]
MLKEALGLVELSMTDFRLFQERRFEPAPDGTTILHGPNGCGKTTVLEAAGLTGSLKSFRGSSSAVMVRTGAERGFVRAEFSHGQRRLTVEVELKRGDAPAAQLNRRRARRSELLTAIPITVFTPGDISLIQGAPAERRAYLDDGLALLDPPGARAAELTERVLHQRGALLRQAGGRCTPQTESTLEVWDQRLHTSGTQLAESREALVESLGPFVHEAYRQTTGAALDVKLSYHRSWEGELFDALGRRRREDLARGITTVGPQRDELVVALDSRDARTGASQGEQRCLAVGLRLAVHRMASALLGYPPILLLDDVLSELDPERSRRLLTGLPTGQALVSTAGETPEWMRVATVIEMGPQGS